MKDIIIIVFATIFVENFVLSKFLGICSFLGVSKNLSDSIGMSGAVVFVMTIASAVTWLVQEYILDPLSMQYLQTITFILVIAALVQVVEIFMKKSLPRLYKALGIYLPLITTNCAVLAVAILNIQRDYTFLESIVFGFSGGVSYMVALVIFAGIRERLELCDIPECFKGFPISLVAAAFVSLAFMGFSGLFAG
ncbi:MAG TPA: electron transport complex subunit RsxA [Clostridiales bacterium]|nr:electron transport complex subunit RsxA [Clostridiales bacterium]